MPPRSGFNNTSLARIYKLKPSTTYRYQVLVDGVRSAEAQFKTAPVPNKPLKFSYALASCMRVQTDNPQPAWDVVNSQNKDFLMLIGDNVYANSTKHRNLWGRHMSQREVPNFAEVLRTTPTYATWDDHDFGPNNSNGNEPGKAESLKTFKDVFANPSYGTAQTPGVFFSFNWGNVEFFVLDNRYHKRVGSDKNYLGQAQLNWLKDKLRASRSPFKAIVSGGTIGNADGVGGNINSNAGELWGFYKEELHNLFNFIKANKIYGVFWHGGDIHYNKIEQWSDKFLGYPVLQIVSSGIAKHVNRYWSMMDVDTTGNSPYIQVRQFKKEVEVHKESFTLDHLSPEGVEDLIMSSPNQGETLTSGNYYPLTWTTIGQISNVIVEYQAGGGSWTRIAELGNTGSYNWKVPNINSRNVKVRVRNANGGQVRFGESPGVFSIERIDTGS